MIDMSIPELLPYAQFLAQISLVVGAFFAGYQFLHARRERDDHAALEVLNDLQSTEFRAAYQQIWMLPLAAPPEDVRGDVATEDAAGCVAMTFETLGIMVHNRIVPLDTVDQVIGGFLRESWRRLEPYIMDQRAKLGAPRYAEWYQWLAERVEVRRKRRTVGAYEAFSTWRE